MTSEKWYTEYENRNSTVLTLWWREFSSLLCEETKCLVHDESEDY